MNREQIIQLANKDPRFSKSVDMMEEQLARQPIVPQDMDEMISFLEHILKDPSKYAEIRDAAIKDGEIDENMFPPQFNMTFVVSLLVALYGLQDRMNQQGYARGGLKVAGRRIASEGRGGDTMLAHINPREAQMLMSRGALGTLNPSTGLPQFKSSWGSILGAILPIALSFIAPGIGTAIGSAISGSLGLGLGAAATSALGAGVIGAGAGALGGGTKGAVIGGLTAGLGNYLLGPAGLVGQATDSMGLTGEGGFLTKATDSLGLTGENGLFSSGAAGAKTATDAVANNVAPAAVDGATNAAADNVSPLARAAIDQSNVPLPPGFENVGKMRPTVEEFASDNSPANYVVQSLKSLVPDKNSTFGDYAKLGILGLTAGSLLTQPKAVQQSVSSLSPDKQEYFNRPSTYWDWDKLQADANQRNMSLTDYLNNNWNNITGGQYNKSTPATPAQPKTAFAAQGGALNQISNLARGSGSGRDDTINAKLSDGEYVMDAETVALLGDGSNAEGARRLDQMRKEIRAQKGKTLAKGKFSPNAKSPLAYLKGAV